MSTHRAPVVLSLRLDAEWAALRRDPAALARARRWAITAEPITDLDELLAAVGHRVSTGDDHERLRRLTELAHTDELAARVVLQRLVPGLLTKVRRRGHAHHRAVFEELVGAAWIAIRTSRHSPGCTNVASALVCDAVHRTFTAPARRRAASEVAVDPSSFELGVDASVVTPFEELVELLIEAREHGLSDDDLQLVRDLLRADSPQVLAAERSVTARTIRNHRARVAHEIRRTTCAA